MQTIAVVNEKGGTGKTTTAVNLSAALGEAGQRVLLVDLDGQAASSRWLGVEEDNRLADALISGGGLEPIPDVAPGVSLAPASGKLDSVSHELRATQGGQLRKVLAPLQDHYDYALIDCPPSLGNRLIGNALLAASHAIVPVEPSILALDGLRILLTTLDDIRDGFDHPIELIGVLACRYESRTNLSKLILAELHRAMPGKVFRTVIRETVKMQECPASGSSILEFSGKNNAAADYRELAHELLAGGPSLCEQPGGFQTHLASQGEDVPLVAQDRMTIEAFRRQAHKSVAKGVTQENAPAADASGPASSKQPFELTTDDKRNECRTTHQSDEPMGSGATVKLAAATGASPQITAAISAAETKAIAPPPAAKAAEQRRADSETSAPLSLAHTSGSKRLRVSPARQRQKTRKHLLVGTAAACVLIGAWAMVRLSQTTPRAAAGLDLSPVPESTLPAEPDPIPPVSATVVSSEAATAEPSPADQTSAEPTVAQEPTTMPAAAKTPAEQTVLATATDTEETEPTVTPTVAPTTMPAPKEAPAEPTKTKFRSAPSDYNLGAIMRGSQGNLAVINGKAVAEGQTVRRARVVQIMPLAVEMELDGQRFTLGLGRRSSAPARETPRAKLDDTPTDKPADQ